MLIAKIMILRGKRKLFRQSRAWKYNELVEVKKKKTARNDFSKKLENRGESGSLKEADLELCLGKIKTQENVL